MTHRMKPAHRAWAAALLAVLALAACNKKPDEAATPASPSASPPAASPANPAPASPSAPAASGAAPVSSMPVEGSQSMTTGPISPKPSQ